MGLIRAAVVAVIGYFVIFYLNSPMFKDLNLVRHYKAQKVLIAIVIFELLI